MIMNQTKLDAILDDTAEAKKIRQVIVDKMKEELSNYSLLISRVNTIPTSNFANNFKVFQDIFDADFTLNTSKKLKISNNRLEPIKNGQREPYIKQRTLKNKDVRDFYFNVVLEKPSFYSRFFNLVRLTKTDQGEPNGDVAFFKVPENDLDKYRLNVKKISLYSKLPAIQQGGIEGDIVFISLIPSYPNDGSVEGVWLTTKIRIDQRELLSYGIDAIRRIAREVYNKPVDANVVMIYAHEVDLSEINRRISTLGYFPVNYKDFFNTIIRTAFNAPGEVATATWSSGELTLSEHMLRQASQWEREDGFFVKRNAKGEKVETKPEDNCVFIDENSRDCLEFFSQCLSSSDESFSKDCAQLLKFKFNFKVNPPISSLKEKVMEINPAFAFDILRKFKFASYLAHENVGSIRNFARYKVQSVGKWLQELISGKPRCEEQPAPCQRPCNPSSLYDQLGKEMADEIIRMSKDPSAYNFFTYLDVLVQWVNANPQVLNPEEVKNPKTTGVYPPPNWSFNSYNYVNPYKPAYVKLMDMECGLRRLKDSILNELAGPQTARLISNISSLPFGIQASLNRPAYVSPVPIISSMPLYGGAGNISMVEEELQRIHQPYGYSLFKTIFENLIQTMSHMVSGNKNIKLRESNVQTIEDKLERFKLLEKKLNEELIELIEKNKLYQASHGLINPFTNQITDGELSKSELAALMEKHSNLLKLSTTYKQKTNNMIDILTTIIRAMLDKFEKSQTGTLLNPTAERPMISTYHQRF